jgi:integrase
MTFLLPPDLTNDNNLLSHPKNDQIQGCEAPINAVNCTGDESHVQLISSGENFDKYLHAALSNNSRRAYQADLQHFIAWGGSVPASPETVCKYLAANVGMLAPATLNRRIVAIGRAHTSQGLASPTKTDLVKATLRGIRRTVGTAQRQVAPAVKEHLIAMVDGLEGIKGIRDRALLLIGFAAALRRSELVAINCTDIEWVDQGMVVHIRRSKTDQEGQGRKVAIPYARGATCPVQSLKAWLSISGITHGPIFRPVTRHGSIMPVALSTQAVAVIVKQRAKAIGLDSSKYSGHSLRAGLVTSAAQAGVSSWKIRQQTGHKSDAMLQRYIRDSQIFIDNAAGAIL